MVLNHAWGRGRAVGGQREGCFPLEKKGINQIPNELPVIGGVGCLVLLGVTIHPRLDDLRASRRVLEAHSVDESTRPTAVEEEPAVSEVNEPLVFHRFRDNSLL